MSRHMLTAECCDVLVCDRRGGTLVQPLEGSACMRQCDIPVLHTCVRVDSVIRGLDFCFGAAN